MKNIGILGSTGSIGTQALDIISETSMEYSVEYITADSNIDLLFKQIKIYNPKKIHINNYDSYLIAKECLNKDIDILHTKDELKSLIQTSNTDIVLNSIVGTAGLEPTIWTIESGIDLALSNKESLVVAGEYINELLLKSKSSLIPVDSEHSAILQCIQGEKMDNISKIILTGSGGPFRTMDIADFKYINLEDALKHPNWSMGNKITIDSATMMNKGLEVIEAFWLFNIDINQIDIVVHPQSIIHSMVEFVDGSVKAQLGLPDMKIPINYALNFPFHTPIKSENLNLPLIGELTFEEPNLIKFKCIDLAYKALKSGGSYLPVLNIANDIVVASFLKKKINFIDIPNYIENAMESHPYVAHPKLDDIYNLIDWTNKHFSNINKEVFSDVN